MALTVTTEHAAIDEVAGRVLALDPVTGTQLGSARRALDGTAWAAFEGDRLALRSADTYPVMVLGDWPADARRELAHVLGTVPDLVGLNGVEDVVAPLAQLVRPGAAITYRQRLFRCDELTEPSGVRGRPHTAGDAELGLVREWFARFGAESVGLGADTRRLADLAVGSGSCRLWLAPSGEPAAMAVQQPPAAGSARIGPVYTPPAQRGHGYASAATAVATRAILDAGDVPVLFTDLANPTANRIYPQLGYRAVEDRVVVRF